MKVRRARHEAVANGAQQPDELRSSTPKTAGSPAAAQPATASVGHAPDRRGLACRNGDEAPVPVGRDPLTAGIPASLLPKVAIGPAQFRVLSPGKQFLAIMSVDLADSARLNNTLPLNPVHASTPVFFRTRGV